MKNFLVRKNCEYSIEISADSEEEAIDEANNTELEYWGEAWSDIEIEDE